MNEKIKRDVPLMLRNQPEQVVTLSVTDPSQVEKFKNSVGITHGGYGFAANEVIVFDDLDPIGATNEESMVLRSYLPYEGAANPVWLVGVTRIKEVAGEKKETRSYLNLSRLTQRGVDGTYPDDFRKTMSEDYPNAFERLVALRGKSLKTIGTANLSMYVFESLGNRKMTENGEYATHEVTVPTVELV